MLYGYCLFRLYLIVLLWVLHMVHVSICLNKLFCLSFVFEVKNAQTYACLCPNVMV